MKLLNSIFIVTVLGRILLEDAADVMDKDETADFSCSNMIILYDRKIHTTSTDPSSTFG